MAWELDEDLRALLVCPMCRGELTDQAGGLACMADKLLFPVENGIPILVRELAKPLEAEGP